MNICGNQQEALCICDCRVASTHHGLLSRLLQDVRFEERVVSVDHKIFLSIGAQTRFIHSQ